MDSLVLRSTFRPSRKAYAHLRVLARILGRRFRKIVDLAIARAQLPCWSPPVPASAWAHAARVLAAHGRVTASKRLTEAERGTQQVRHYCLATVAGRVHIALA